MPTRGRNKIPRSGPNQQPNNPSTSCTPPLHRAAPKYPRTSSRMRAHRAGSYDIAEGRARGITVAAAIGSRRFTRRESESADEIIIRRALFRARIDSATRFMARWRERSLFRALGGKIALVRQRDF